MCNFSLLDLNAQKVYSIQVKLYKYKVYKTIFEGFNVFFNN